MIIIVVSSYYHIIQYEYDLFVFINKSQIKIIKIALFDSIHSKSNL
jgi:hypothetical protein